MKILVFGVGAIGSLMAHYLCKAGNDVTVVARSTYEELNKNGLVIRHYLQKKTTVDHPRIVKEADERHYDIVFSVMQGQQQLTLLPVLSSLNADLLVLVGNNMETDKCEEALNNYAPQNTNDAKTKSRDYFNNHRRSRLAGGGYWRHDYKYAFSIIKKIKPGSLIDIGCGPGAFLSEVSRLFPDVQLNALDLSEEMIEETRNRLSGKVIATVGDSENMPLEDEQYQVVTCNMSIHHYPHPQKAVNEMYRILKNGGYILLNDMDCVFPIRAVANFCFPRMKAGDVKMYNRNEILELMKTAGFKKVKYRKISPFTFQCIAKKQRI